MSSLISLSKSLSFLFGIAGGCSGLGLAARVETTEAALVETAGDAILSGTAEPARRVGWRNPVLLVVGAIAEAGRAGPAIVFDATCNQKAARCANVKTRQVHAWTNKVRRQGEDASGSPLGKT